MTISLGSTQATTPSPSEVLDAATAQTQASAATATAPGAVDVAPGAMAATAVTEQDRATMARVFTDLASGGGVQGAKPFKPTLPAVNAELMPANLSGEDLTLWATSTFNSTQDKLGQASMGALENQKARLAQVNADKLEKIKEAQQKALDAEPGFWSKAFSWLSNIASAVVAAVAIVVGTLATATGVGAAIGVPLLLLGGYMMAGAVVGMVEDVRREQGLPPLGWSPTLGHLAGMLAKAAGASEETQAWIKLAVDVVTDIAVGVAISVLVPGGAIAVGMRAMSAMNKLSQVQSTVRKVTQVTEAVDAAATMGKGVTGAVNAVDQRDAAVAKAEVKKTTALLTKMQAIFQALAEDLKKVLERQADNLQRCSDMVAERGAAVSQMTANMA